MTLKGFFFLIACPFAFYEDTFLFPLVEKKIDWILCHYGLSEKLDVKAIY